MLRLFISGKTQYIDCRYFIINVKAVLHYTMNVLFMIIIYIHMIMSALVI